MKWYEWAAALGIMAGGAVMVLFVALLASLPYVAFAAVVLVCFRYLGWF